MFSTQMRCRFLCCSWPLFLTVCLVNLRDVMCTLNNETVTCETCRHCIHQKRRSYEVTETLDLGLITHFFIILIPLC